VVVERIIKKEREKRVNKGGEGKGKRREKEREEKEEKRTEYAATFKNLELIIHHYKVSNREDVG
jgi:hypothetical protein